MNQTFEQALQAAGTAKVVAVYGMTDGRKPGRPSFEIPKMLHDRGVRIIPVNPRIEAALDIPALKTLDELDVKPDILNVYRKPADLPQLMEELLALPPEKRPACVWLQTGIVNPEVEARLEADGYQVVSDLCLGVLKSRSEGGNFSLQHGKG